jgi:hypothetical protein
VKEEELEDSSPPFHELDKSNQICGRKLSSTNNETLDPKAYANCESLEPLQLSSSSLDIPNCRFVDIKSFTSITGKKHDDNDDSNTKCRNVKGNYANSKKSDVINCKSYNNNNGTSSTFGNNLENSRAPQVERRSSLQNDTVESGSSPSVTSDYYTKHRSHCKSFNSAPADKTISTVASKPEQLLNRTGSLTNYEKLPTKDSSELDRNRRHSGCVFHINVTPEDPNSSTSLLSASPSPFTLSCHCDPADNFQKFIGCHFPESIHHKLVKKNILDPRTLTSPHRRSSADVKSHKSSSTEQRTTTLSPSGCSQTGRSLSFPSLAEPKEEVLNPGEYSSR